LLKNWWEIVLNDYSKGVLEALAWVQQLPKELDTLKARVIEGIEPIRETFDAR